MTNVASASSDPVRPDPVPPDPVPPDPCVVLVTAGSQDEAIAIASALVEQSLAACVSLTPIQSIYRWDGAIQRDSEWQLTIKTTMHCWDDLQRTVHALHSYEVPELIAIPITVGSAAYVSWLTAETSSLSRPDQL